MEEDLKYTGLGLNRAVNQRKDPKWVSKHLRHNDTVIIPVWRGLNLFQLDPRGNRPPKGVFSIGKQAQLFASNSQTTIFLGLVDKTAYFAVDISSLDKGVVETIVKNNVFKNLRHMGALISREQGALLAYARGMAHWHQNHLFCGICGHPTNSHNGGHLLICQNQVNAHMHFPRTDPAVIMLVAHQNPEGKGPACLLGRQKNWIDGMYSTLAGFVEPGESLEEAVAREVLEESAIKVTNINYSSSQPWPFPASLMIGFRAQANTKKIKVDHNELEDAKWFAPEYLQNFIANDKKNQKFRLPGKDSIARQLIEEWIIDMISI